jgi:hypothetical protein
VLSAKYWVENKSGGWKLAAFWFRKYKSPRAPKSVHGGSGGGTGSDKQGFVPQMLQLLLLLQLQQVHFGHIYNECGGGGGGKNGGGNGGGWVNSALINGKSDGNFGKAAMAKPLFCYYWGTKVGKFGENGW